MWDSLPDGWIIELKRPYLKLKLINHNISKSTLAVFLPLRGFNKPKFNFSLWNNPFAISFGGSERNLIFPEFFGYIRL